MEKSAIETIKLNRMHKLDTKQSGGAAILMAFIIALAAIAYLLHALDPIRLKSLQDERTVESLNAAKQSLIAWSAGHLNYPGLMPYPDRNADGNYDDTSDCYATNVDFASHFTIGRLPLFKNDPNCINTRLTVVSGVADSFRDASGERLWYEVSRNLLHDYKNNGGNPNGTSPIINPSIINSPLNPWLIVRDRSGNIISDRVAAVIIAAGAPIGAQDRSGAIANANQYLDKIVMANGTPYQNYGYQDPATNPKQNFITGDDFKTVAKNDPAYKNQEIEPYYFNDKLVYITIDELMYELEKRALNETKDVLKKFKSANNFYPFAAGFGSNSNPNQCTQGNLRGLLPTAANTNHTCTCAASSKTCNCNFSIVNSTAFTRTTGNFVATGAIVNAPTGACSVQPIDTKTCICNGAGACKSTGGVTQFICNDCGICKSNVLGTNKFNTTGTFSAVSGICTNPLANQATCANSADGSFTLAACAANEQIKSMPVPPAVATGDQLLPYWITANQWEKFIVYSPSIDCVSTATCLASSSPPKIKVGLNLNVNAIVAGSLANAAGSCNISSYLSSPQNTNVIVSNGIQDSEYQITQLKTMANTDQLMAVFP